MRALPLFVVILLSSVAGAQKRPAARPVAAWEVCFAPSASCSRLIVELVAAAKKSVRVQAYGFTDVDVAEALLAAKRRGVDVEVILDRSNRNRKKYTTATFLVNFEIPTAIDEKHPIAHNKVIIVDDATVITGSYNFTKAARRNAENLLVLRSPELAAKYIENWKVHRAHSERLN